MDFQSEPPSAVDRLIQNALGAPIDLFEKRAMQFLEADQIISAIVGRPEHDRVVLLWQNTGRVGKCLLRHGRAVGIDETNRWEAEREDIFGREN